jgi:uncharacterized protein (TIGR00369 family)
MRRLAEHGSCFVCGTANPHGMHVTWYADQQGRVSTRITLSEAHQGPPGYAHGGASAALIDEVMGAAVWYAGNRVVVVNLECAYRHPLPLGVELTVWGEVVDQSGRTVWARGEIVLPNGTPAVIGRGIYVEAPQFFENALFQAFEPIAPDGDQS